MFKYSKDGISVLTIGDTRRAIKSGQFLVKFQVVYRRKQKYYSTGPPSAYKAEYAVYEQFPVP